MNRTSQQLSRFSTQIPQAAPKRIAASFKPGPFRGALLASEPRQDHDQQPQHDYSASQLLRAARTTPSSSSASPPATTTLHFPHSRLIRQHLDELLYPLTFSDQLACRIVSSKNLLKSQHALDALEHHAPGGVGFARLGEHNSKLSFIGRRAMHFALSNFLLHAPRPPTPPPSPSSDPHHHRYRSGRPTSEVIEDALLTKFVLGQTRPAPHPSTTHQSSQRHRALDGPGTRRRSDRRRSHGRTRRKTQHRRLPLPRPPPPLLPSRSRPPARHQGRPNARPRAREPRRRARRLEIPPHRALPRQQPRPAAGLRRAQYPRTRRRCRL
ncbi:hypothetical protein PTTG_08583, partial [Puccinia triticina 1-1 BBBD Race 1]